MFKLKYNDSFLNNKTNKINKISSIDCLMTEKQLEQTSEYIKIVKNSKDSNLPSKPKILTGKKTQKQQIIQFLVKSSPLKTQKDNQHQNKQYSKVQNAQQSQKIKISSKIDERQRVGKELSHSDFIKKLNINHQRSDSLISSQNTQNLFYEQLNRSQSTVHISPKKQSVLSIGQTSNKYIQSRSKSRSKLIRKQTITNFSKTSQSKSNKLLSTSPQFMAQNRFYHYCAQQIIKLSNSTEQIKTNIKNKHIQTNKIKQMNNQLQIKIQKQKKQMKDYQAFRQKLQERKTNLSQQINQFQKQVLQKLPQKYRSQYQKNHEEQTAQMKIKTDQIKKQQQAIQYLRAELNTFARKEQQKSDIQAQNKKLRQEIQKLKSKRLNYDSKILKNNHITKHLQQIKIVEYQNLLNIFN